MSSRRTGIFVHQGAELYGSDYVFKEVISSLRNDWNIYVVLDQDGPLVAELHDLCHSVTVCRLGVLRRSKRGFIGISVLLWEGLVACLRLALLARRCSADLMYSNTLGVWSPLVAARLVRIPSIQHLHEIVERPHILAKVMYGVTGRLARRIICVSDAVVKHVKSLYPASVEKCVLVRNGLVDINRDALTRGLIRDEFEISQSRIMVAMVGRLHFWKGQDVLLKAVWLLSKCGIYLEVIVFGDVFVGYEAFGDKLHALCAEYGIADQIHFAGFRRDVTNLLIDSDIVVVPSTLPDPFPTVALEALRAGVPLILSSSSGAAEVVVDGVSAMLCVPGSAEDLANKLRVLVETPELRTKLSKNGREVYERALGMAEFRNNIKHALSGLLD